MDEISERQRLENLAGYIDVAREELLRDWSKTQGALREFYNRMPAFLEGSGLSEDNKRRLIAVADFVFDTREGLMQGMEVKRLDLEQTIKQYHLREKLELLGEYMGNCISAWYQG